MCWFKRILHNTLVWHNSSAFVCAIETEIFCNSELVFIYLCQLHKPSSSMRIFCALIFLFYLYEWNTKTFPNFGHWRILHKKISWYSWISTKFREWLLFIHVNSIDQHIHIANNITNNAKWSFDIFFFAGLFCCRYVHFVVICMAFWIKRPIHIFLVGLANLISLTNKYNLILNDDCGEEEKEKNKKQHQPQQFDSHAKIRIISGPRSHICTHTLTHSTVVSQCLGAKVYRKLQEPTNYYEIAWRMS